MQRNGLSEIAESPGDERGDLRLRRLGYGLGHERLRGSGGPVPFLVVVLTRRVSPSEFL